MWMWKLKKWFVSRSTGIEEAGVSERTWTINSGGKYGKGLIVGGIEKGRVLEKSRGMVMRPAIGEVSDVVAFQAFRGVIPFSTQE
jgi:hypothetical protein